jgi:DNA-binding NtrC family response regulator
VKTPSTVALKLPEALPIAGLRVEVVEGPDAGKAYDAAQDSITVGTAEGNDLVVTDPTVSRYHVELEAIDDGVRVTDHGSTNGTRIGAVRVERGVAALGSLVEVGRTKLRVTDGRRGVVDLHDADALGELRGRTNVMRRLMAKVKRVATSNVPVLLVGETGTGKELIARAIHDQSDRRERPFITVDCGALSPSLFASQLFGHERGAFTGAHERRAGAFEEAHGGTVFLDELGELPAELQSHLLGVLERQRFRRVGGSQELAVDVRVVAATNRDLREEVNQGRFRLDLYYRVAAVRIDIPPLRDRPDDIPLLVAHFLREAGHGGPVASVLDAAKLAELKQHRWPGNVRELRNYVEAVVATGEGTLLDAPGEPQRPQSDDVTDLPYKEARRRVVQAFERAYLSRLVERADGNVSKAARMGKMDRSHLSELLRRHGLR